MRGGASGGARVYIYCRALPSALPSFLLICWEEGEEMDEEGEMGREGRREKGLDGG